MLFLLKAVKLQHIALSKIVDSRNCLSSVIVQIVYSKESVKCYL